MQLQGQVVLLYIECGVACNAPEYKLPICDSASLLTAIVLASEQRGMLTHPALCRQPHSVLSLIKSWLAFLLSSCALQMNSDPRLEFGLGTPVIQEMAPPDPSELLQASREPLRQMMGIETDEDWQVCPVAF